MRIAFVGRAGSGKTTLADYLVSRYGFAKLSFAAKLKGIAYQILGRRYDKHHYRWFLQELGSLCRRADPECWIRPVVNRIDNGITYRSRDLVVDDCRYLNEAKALRKRGFILIKLAGRGYDLDPSEATHESEIEMEWIMWDYLLDASKPLNMVKDELDVVIKWIKKKGNFSS